MSAVLMRARAELRARFASMLALAILLGLGSGAVMTTIAGARRTDSAYERFAREYKAADVLVFPAFDETFADISFEDVAASPLVIAAAKHHFLGGQDPTIQVFAGDAELGKSVNRVKVLDGRLPAAQSLDEASISFALANRRHLHMGSSIPLVFGTYERKQVSASYRVVGIEAAPGEFPPLFGGGPEGQDGSVRLSTAAYESLKARNVFSLDFAMIRLQHGRADFRAMNDRLSALAKGKVQVNQNLGAQADNVQRSIHLQAVALRIVGSLVALIGLLVLSQLIARQATIDASETPTLLALGMTRRQVSLAGLGRATMLGVAGGVIGVVGAAAASPLMPIGNARIAEPDTGLSFDPLVLGLGALTTMIVIVALSAWPLWRASKVLGRQVDATARLSLPARSAAGAGFSPAVGTGVRLALETGRGTTAVPVRSSLTSVIVAIAALVAALTFGAGLDHLLASPRQYGWNWDAHLTNDTENATAEDAMKILEADPAVEVAAGVDAPPLRLGKGIPFDAMAIQQHKGTLEPVVLSGRAPRAASEVALGVRTLREAHLHVGSTVHISISAIEGGGASFTVVGTVVMPPNSDTARLGSGGVITYDGEKAMAPKDFKNFPPITDVYLRFARGVDKKKELKRLGEALGDFTVVPPQRPGDLVNFGQVQNLPFLLAGLVAVLAAATLAQTLVTSIRRRRRDLAILKMLGFVPRQVRSAVAWQATTFVSASLLIGLPVGIVMGRLIWTVFANQLGTLPDPVTPWMGALLTIPAAIVLANVIAAVPAVMAGRMKPAAALHAE